MPMSVNEIPKIEPLTSLNLYGDESLPEKRNAAEKNMLRAFSALLGKELRLVEMLQTISNNVVAVARSGGAVVAIGALMPMCSWGTWTMQIQTAVDQSYRDTDIAERLTEFLKAEFDRLSYNRK
jgi:hypothetical protein